MPSISKKSRIPHETLTTYTGAGWPDAGITTTDRQDRPHRESRCISRHQFAQAYWGGFLTQRRVWECALDYRNMSDIFTKNLVRLQIADQIIVLHLKNASHQGGAVAR